MRLEVHSIVANEHNSRVLNPLINKLGYKLRKLYADKGYQIQQTCLTLIV
ncbi:MAG: hypothetical protein ACMUEL_06365 [Flavobacteriales bacterium Tduv]